MAENGMNGGWGVGKGVDKGREGEETREEEVRESQGQKVTMVLLSDKYTHTHTYTAFHTTSHIVCFK